LRVITQPMPPTDLETTNRRELRKLELSIEAQPQSLGLLLAICDDRNLQAQLIEQYEAELQAAGIATYRTRLSHQRPSLKAALLALVEQKPALQTGDPAVVTVLNAGELLGVRLSDKKSEQEQFFFSLQWTRESLRQFNFPIVLWLPDEVATRLAQQAPDFWSWRSGVFEFFAAPNTVHVIRADGLQTSPMRITETTVSTDTDSQIPITDLEQQIATLTKLSPDSPLLITLHNILGEAYERQHHYQDALMQYEQALKKAEAHEDKTGQARSLRNIGDALQDFGRLDQAVLYYQRALVLDQTLQDWDGQAATLNQLGNTYCLLGQHSRAIDYYQQSLETARKIGTLQGKANVLGNLGSVYFSLGQHQQAINFYQQSLEIARKMENRQIEANALGNLGNAYCLLGQHSQAIDFYRQSLEIDREIKNLRGEAASLNNLGWLYRLLGQYPKAIDLFQQTLEVARKIGDNRSEAYPLLNKALVLEKLGDISGARSHYEAAEAIFNDLGLQDLAEQCEKAIQALND